MKMYDVWSSPKELYLVLEYVQGGELFDYLCSRGSRLSLLEAIAIIKQVLAGVDYCHRFHICHRDLKPENILLTNDGTGNDQYKRVKIADFGMSALDSLNGLLRTSCGSPHYASPEIVRGHTYSGATSDIWSCGVILYALLTSRLPFDDPNVNNVLRKVRDGRFTIPEWVAPPAKDLLIRMLEVDLSKRITVSILYITWLAANLGRCAIFSNIRCFSWIRQASCSLPCQRSKNMLSLSLVNTSMQTCFAVCVSFGGRRIRSRWWLGFAQTRTSLSSQIIPLIPISF